MMIDAAFDLICIALLSERRVRVRWDRCPRGVILLLCRHIGRSSPCARLEDEGEEKREATKSGGMWDGFDL